MARNPFIPSDLPYGKSHLTVCVPGDRLAPRDAEGACDETCAVLDALECPIGTAPLREIVRPGERVAIVVLFDAAGD